MCVCVCLCVENHLLHKSTKAYQYKLMGVRHGAWRFDFQVQMDLVKIFITYLRQT